MIRTTLTFALILLTSAAGAHFPIAQRMRQIDSNHDHALSITEVLAARQARFVALDQDQNQVLTLAEISSKVSSRNADPTRPNVGPKALDRISERFSRLDKNQDARITQAEWNDRVVELFARFDVNNDHLITRPEVRSVWQSKRAQR